MQTTQEAVIAVHRFGMGGAPQLIETVAKDPKGWLLAQVTPEREPPPALKALPSTMDDQLAFFRWLYQYRNEIKAAGGVNGATSGAHGATAQGDTAQNAAPSTMQGEASAAPKSGTVEGSFAKTLVPRYAAATAARFDAATTTDRPFFEHLVHFWSNHFVVSGAKPVAIALPPSYQRDAIRPHVTGRFADMLLAVAKHPAMLIYLDNTQSIGPHSEWAKNPPRRYGMAAQFPRPTGLNENLAREILELHTVGVDGGYDQNDVTSFAKVITGWQVVGPRQLVRFAARYVGIGSDLFHFNEDAHEPGAQTVMGVRYAQDGVAQGEAVLNDLARKPSTAHFIATKLARHFVADSPPEELVGALAKTFSDTDGDLGAVTRTLVESNAAWDPSRRKLKQPEEFMISAVRSLDGPPLKPHQVLGSLREMGQRPNMQPGPDGWSELEDHWLSPDGVWKRIEWSELAGRALSATISRPLEYAEQLFGPTLSEASRTAISRAESPAQALTLLLTSPEFMRR